MINSKKKALKTNITGCVHLHVSNGEIVRVCSHLSDVPLNDGVIHIQSIKPKPLVVHSIKWFKKTHQEEHKGDLKELNFTHKENKMIYNLGNESIPSP